MRHYKPKKAYIFLTKKICQYDLIDNRYEIIAKKLQELLDFRCVITKIEREDIDNPQDFEFFYQPFESILNNIQKENPDSEILVNISSGTPAMKQVCYMLCAIAVRKITPIQVVSFRGEERIIDPHGSEKYDIENEWDNLIDNNSELEPENRCSEIKVKNVRAVFSREIILELIRSYDYNAALKVAKKIEYFIDNKIIDILSAAKYRLDLSDSYAQKSVEDIGYDLFPVKTEPAKKIFEYILVLSVKVKKGYLADFTRGISPVILELFIEACNFSNNKDIKNFCDYDKKKEIYYLRRELMSDLMPELLDYYDQYYSGTKQRCFTNSPISASNILPYIIYTYGEESMITILAKDLREFENKARNQVAHIITEVTDEWLKDRTNLNGNEVLTKLKKIYSLIFKKHHKQIEWDSYDRVNQDIEKLLKAL